jgi:hypothetical protein
MGNSVCTIKDRKQAEGVKVECLRKTYGTKEMKVRE